ncbi:uncharacterized protein ACRADG_005056 [Cochliomyia hominivorax]
MFKKKVLTILVVSWCLAESLATPVDNSENFDLCQLKTKYASVTASEKDATLAPSIQLLKMMLVALKEFSYNYITKAKPITEELLNDAVLKENHSKEVEEFLDKIKEFSEKYSSCTNMDELFNLVVSFSTITSDFYDMEDKNTLTEDSKVILKELKKNKIHDIENEFEKSFLDFVEKFTIKMDEVKEKLKEEKIGDKILKWWDGVKDLKTFEEKMEGFSKFTHLYEIE